MSTYYPPSTDLKFVKTTREEERELFRKMKAGDAQARETIIKHHLLFVAIVARKCANGAALHAFQDDELVSAANEALIQAIDRKQFDETRGYRFTSYLRPFIRGAISKMWRERAKYVQMPEDLEAAIPDSANFGANITVDHPVEEAEFQEFMLKALESGKANLTEREQLVLSLMYERGMNGAQIGRQLKMTRERVRQIHEEILTKLRKTLHKQGIDRR